VYVLNHNPALEEELAANGGHLLPSPANVIRVGENDTTAFCLPSITQMRHLLGGTVYDPVHHALSLPGFDWHRDWEILVATANNLKPQIIHLSEGTDPGDSIPHNMPLEWYQHIARLIRGGVYPVFERQWGPLRGSEWCRPHTNRRVLEYMYKQTLKYKQAGAFA